MAPNQSALLALPPELRIVIWALVLQDYPISDKPVCVSSAGQIGSPPAFLKASKHIRDDALQIWCIGRGFTFFHLTGDSASIQCCCNWLGFLGESAVKYVQRFTVRLPRGWYTFDINLDAEDEARVVTRRPRPVITSIIADHFHGELEGIVLRVRATRPGGRLSIKDWERLFRAVGTTSARYR